MRLLFEVAFRQAVPELEALASSKTELMQPWDGYAVARYNRLVEEGKVPRFEMMGVYSARRVITPAMVKAVCESVRTQALELALDLQAANPLAGESDGPTRADPAIDRALTVNINHIYGDGANVAQGSGITQTSTVSKGDLVGLTTALQRLFPDAKTVGEAVAIITSDSSAADKESKLRKIGEAIKAGSINLAAGITTDVAAAGLIELACQFLGL